MNDAILELASHRKSTVAKVCLIGSHASKIPGEFLVIIQFLVTGNYNSWCLKIPGDFLVIRYSVLPRIIISR